MFLSFFSDRPDKKTDKIWESDFIFLGCYPFLIKHQTLEGSTWHPDAELSPRWTTSGLSKEYLWEMFHQKTFLLYVSIRKLCLLTHNKTGAGHTWLHIWTESDFPGQSQFLQFSHLWSACHGHTTSPEGPSPEAGNRRTQTSWKKKRQMQQEIIGRSDHQWEVLKVKCPPRWNVMCFETHLIT